MEIHVVKSGDTLWKLAKTYGVSTKAIVRVNELAEPDSLVRGQALLIPMSGQYAKAKPLIYTSAYLDPSMTGTRSAQQIDKVGEHLTYLNIFSYEVRSNASLVPVEDGSIIDAALRDRVAPLLVLTNLENGRFSTELATSLFTNELLQDQVLDQALHLMHTKGYRGLDIDFEYLGAQNRNRYVRFLQKAAQRVKPLGYTISVALAPKISSTQKGILYEGHDYQAIGEVVDFIFFMTYEWGWSGGKPLAVSPLGQVRRVMNYAVSVVPRDKIMMGMPLYGYDWTLPYTPGKWAKSISPQRALQLALTYGASIQYDQSSQAPWFHYNDAQGKEHEVWFEDARSIQAKFDLVKELRLRGFYYWVLGHEFPQNWALLQDNFTVRKVF